MILKYIFLIALGLGNLIGANAQEANKYNVLFISVDDLNTDIGSYGHPLVKTPNIDRLANKGVQFNGAYCQYPLCNPSRASIMTGLNPDKIKIYDLNTHFRKNVPDIITLPQLFMKHGYFSARVGKIYHYGVPGGIGKNGLDDSSSWHKRINPIGRDKADEAKLTRLLPRKVGLGVNLAFLEAEGTDEEQTDGIVANEAINLLIENKDKPFFIAAGFFRPHLPSIAPKKYFDLYPLHSIVLPFMPEDDMDDIPEAALFTRPTNWNLSEIQRQQAIRAYYATITFIDAQVGRILSALDSLNLTHKTIVVLWSDHGFNLGEHGQWQKRSLFEKSAKVPLIISVPGGIGGKSTNSIVELVDLYPTVADLCSIKPMHDLSGKSLKPLLQNPDAFGNRAAYTQVSLGDTNWLNITREIPGFDESEISFNPQAMNIMGRSVRTDRYRYTEWDFGRLGVELYDELNDPNEFKNLAKNKNFKKIVRTHAKLLKQHFKK
jgi:iduronate 2-sulfatase